MYPPREYHRHISAARDRRISVSGIARSRCSVGLATPPSPELAFLDLQRSSLRNPGPGNGTASTHGACAYKQMGERLFDRALGTCESRVDVEEDQASRPISTARLNVLPRVHLPPIHAVVSCGPSGTCRYGRSHLGGGFPLRCFQRLSLPDVATLRCPWRDNRYTSGQSTPVLSY